jgi:hypothetical protein
MLNFRLDVSQKLGGFLVCHVNHAATKLGLPCLEAAACVGWSRLWLARRMQPTDAATCVDREYPWTPPSAVYRSGSSTWKRAYQKVEHNYPSGDHWCRKGHRKSSRNNQPRRSLIGRKALHGKSTPPCDVKVRSSNSCGEISRNICTGRHKEAMVLVIFLDHGSNSRSPLRTVALRVHKMMALFTKRQ